MTSRDWSLPDGWPLADENAAWDEVQRELEARGLGDGLPLVPPTRRRLDGMLAGIAEPSRACGIVPPLLGELTPAALAYACVTAGCRPSELPIALSALLCCLEPDFNLLGIQTTTGSASVAIIVHGPIASRLDVNAGTNCLGPGARANACIGRAVRLALVAIGGAHPGVGDMATLGQPGKYTFCFADRSDVAGFPPLHVWRGLAPDADAVTVLAPSGTVEILPSGNGDTVEDIVGPLALMMRSARTASAGCLRRIAPEQFFILPPELAAFLHRRGCDAERLSRRIADASGEAADAIHPIVAGGAGVKMGYLPIWGGGSLSVTRALVSVIS